jgi:hypothetical protein
MTRAAHEAVVAAAQWAEDRHPGSIGADEVHSVMTWA